MTWLKTTLDNAAPTVTRAVEVLPDIVKPTITLNGKAN
jgi:hypothetical protein